MWQHGSDPGPQTSDNAHTSCFLTHELVQAMSISLPAVQSWKHLAAILVSLADRSRLHLWHLQVPNRLSIAMRPLHLAGFCRSAPSQMRQRLQSSQTSRASLISGIYEGRNICSKYALVASWLRGTHGPSPPETTKFLRMPKPPGLSVRKTMTSINSPVGSHFGHQ